MKYKYVLSLVFLAFFVAPSSAGEFFGVADITEVKGKAFVKHSGKKKWNPAEQFMILSPNDEVKTGIKADLHFYFWPTNESVKLAASAHVRLGKDGYKIIKGKNIATETLSKPQKETSQVGATSLRGIPPASQTSTSFEDSPVLKARSFWVRGKIDEAIEEYEEILKTKKHKGKLLNKHLNLLKKEKAKRSAFFDDAMHQLAEQLKEKEGETKKVKICIGKVTYADSNIGGSLSIFLASELSAALIKSDIFQEISRRELKQVLEEQKFSLSGLIDSSEEVQLGKIKGVDAILTGTYWEQEASVRVSLSLVRVLTAEKIAVASFSLPESILPIGLEAKPKNYDDCTTSLKTWKEQKGASKDFKTKIWVGNSPGTPAGLEGGVYKKGEKITVFFWSNRNCYLRLYHTNVQGKIHLLFPNSYDRNNYIEKGRVYLLPNEDSPFEFKITPPLGAEIIKAVTSLQPFSEDEFIGEGRETFRSLGTATQENIRRIMQRSIALVPVEARAEATYVFTTVEE